MSIVLSAIYSVSCFRNGILLRSFRAGNQITAQGHKHYAPTELKSKEQTNHDNEN